MPQRLALAACAAVAVMAATVPGTASAVPVQAATPPPVDFCFGQCDDILPPGQNGHATFVQLLAFQLLGIRPRHSSDTRAPYERLVWNHRGLTDERLGDFFNDAALVCRPLMWRAASSRGRT